MTQKLLFIAICASLTACCHKNCGRYESFMNDCSKIAMSYHNSETDVKEVCHCATMKILDLPEDTVGTDELISQISDACINEFVQKRLK